MVSVCVCAHRVHLVNPLSGHLLFLEQGCTFPQVCPFAVVQLVVVFWRCAKESRVV